MTHLQPLKEMNTVNTESPAWAEHLNKKNISTVRGREDNTTGDGPVPNV